MGNAASYQRNYLYWGAILLLMIPLPNDTHGWNIPHFGGDGGPGANTNYENAHPTSPQPTDDHESASLMSAVAAPIIGPLDAPHFRYVPSYFSKQKFFPTITSALRSARLKLYQLLWYKPPVGIVGAWSFLRVMEKVYGIFSPPAPSSGAEALVDAEGRLRGAMNTIMPSRASFRSSPWGSLGRILYNGRKKQTPKARRKRKSKFRKGRSFDLDSCDRSYDNFGGVETVRVRACQEALHLALEVASSEVTALSLNGNSVNEVSLFGTKRNVDDVVYDGMSKYLSDIESAIEALQRSCPPRGSREQFVQSTAEPLSALNKYTTILYRDSDKKGTGKEPSISTNEQNFKVILHHSSKLAELRTLDAILRILRDRHLIVAARLRRTKNYWKWHVNLSGGNIGNFVQAARRRAMSVCSWMGDDSRDRNQREYELATATLEKELELLGKVERLLLGRPLEMEVGNLLSIVGENKQKQLSWWNNFAQSTRADSEVSSKPSLSTSVEFFLEGENQTWLTQTEEWSRKAREVIRDSLDETISSVFTTIEEPDELDEKKAGKSCFYAESLFLQQWATYNKKTSDSFSWLTVLSLVDYAATPRRAGERNMLQLSRIAAAIKQFDFLRIPSSALLLVGASSLHDKVIAPHKQEIVEFVKGIFTMFWGILEFRFYNPVKDIVLDLLNRRPRMVDPFALLNEQTSLDNMLMDLGVGDGTRETRATALAAASRMYEQEVAGGAIRGIVRGKVAQLMLIQIQQLKADLLQAMDTIDNLVDANRLNVQLVASIPAVLILFFGTRALVFFWSNIRMKDFRLPQDVHAEMSDYLKKAEELIILSNCQLDALAGDEESPTARAEACLRPKEMGNLLLFLHSYLNLLDYMSPPFPSNKCNSIHQSMQNLLVQGQMSASRQLELMKVIQSKHTDLIKSL